MGVFVSAAFSATIHHMRARHEVIELLIRKYERYVAPFTFVAGFLLDTITLQRVDLWMDHMILTGYLAIAGAGIMILNLYESGRLRFRMLEWGIQFVPVLMQFAFGGLFSAFIIFYTKSGTLAKSWLFFLVLAVLLVGNERFRRRYQRFTFQLSIFFVALFSYAIFALPVLVGAMGVGVFLAGGIVSLIATWLFVLLLAQVTPQQIAQSRQALLWSIGGIYALFHLLYFANIIPPIPLSLKGSGVYHAVERTVQGYAVRYEPARWYAFFSETSSLYHWQEGEPIYFFSSVFAPTRFTAAIFHRWSYYGAVEERWIEYANVSFPIMGGRDGGYRGYSFITGIRPGKWRVEVVNGRGQVLGQEKFTVIKREGEIGIREGIK